MKKYILLLGASAALMTACQNEPIDGPTVDDNIIRIEANLGTRATLDAFEVDDTISLYAVEYNNEEVAPLQVVGNYINNEPVTLTNSGWTTQRTLYWTDNKCDFYAFYPYQEISSAHEQLFELQTDQNVEGGYEQSDLMWAKTENIGKTDNNGAVALQFNHLMSRVVVNLVKGESYEGELPDEITAHIYNTATTAQVDFADGSLEKYLYSDKKTITMRQIDAASFDAIVVPQHIERSTPLIEITMEGIAYLLEYSISFRPGYQHTLTVTLNTSPDQEKIEINIDGEVGDWE